MQLLSRIRLARGSSADVGLHAACQSDEFAIGQRKDGVRDAAGGPKHLELSERTIHDSVVSRTTISNGLKVNPSATKRIDSRLDRFFVNGYHGTVTVSPIIVSSTEASTPTIGRTTTAAQQTTSARKATENDCGSVVNAIAPLTSARRSTCA